MAKLIQWKGPEFQRPGAALTEVRSSPAWVCAWNLGGEFLLERSVPQPVLRTIFVDIESLDIDVRVRSTFVNPNLITMIAADTINRCRRVDAIRTLKLANDVPFGEFGYNSTIVRPRPCLCHCDVLLFRGYQHGAAVAPWQLESPFNLTISLRDFVRKFEKAFNCLDRRTDRNYAFVGRNEDLLKVFVVHPIERNIQADFHGRRVHPKKPLRGNESVLNRWRRITVSTQLAPKRSKIGRRLEQVSIAMYQVRDTDCTGKAERDDVPSGSKVHAPTLEKSRRFHRHVTRFSQTVRPSDFCLSVTVSLGNPDRRADCANAQKRLSNCGPSLNPRGLYLLLGRDHSRIHTHA